MKRIVLPIFLVLLAGTPIYAEGERPASEMRWPGAGPDAQPLQDVAFETSSDPEEAVLVYESSGSYNPISRLTTIYGDGRVHLSKQTLSGKVLEEHSFHITQTDLRSLLRVALEHGMLELSGQELEARRQELGARMMVTDVSTITLTISLKSYSRNGELKKFSSNSIRSYAPAFYATQYPEILQYRGFYLLKQEIYKLWQTARGIEQ